MPTGGKIKNQPHKCRPLLLTNRVRITDIRDKDYLSLVTFQLSPHNSKSGASQMEDERPIGRGICPWPSRCKRNASRSVAIEPTCRRDAWQFSGAGDRINVMDLSEILKELHSELERIDRAILAFEGLAAVKIRGRNGQPTWSFVNALGASQPRNAG
jgi:hypothetical protein